MLQIEQQIEQQYLVKIAEKRFPCEYLQNIVQEIERITGATLKRILADAGYRGHNAPLSHKFRVFTAGQKRRVTKAIKCQMKRRSAVEPVIGHLKSGYRMNRNYLAHQQLTAEVGDGVIRRWRIMNKLLSDCVDFYLSTQQVFSSFPIELENWRKMMTVVRNQNLLWGALKVTLISVVLSLLITFAAVFFTSGNSQELVTGLQQGLSIGAIVPILVAFPVSYYVQLQRQKMKVVSDKLAFLLRYDQLTSLLTRRAFFQDVESALKRMHGKNQPNAAFFIDLDHFKQVNDKFGHATGDEVLRLFGKVMKEYLQSGEIAGRMGGEEFCMFVQNCPPEQALERAQKLVDVFRLQAQVVDNKDVGCTLSVGVAVSTQIDDLDRFLSEADRLLYFAKENGRNCVAMDNEPVSQTQIAA